MGELTDSEIEELLGAYALDAVEADEAAQIEAHLAGCPRCRAELSAHREVAGLFAYAGQSAPAGLWDRITAGMQEPPPELRLERIRPSMVTAERVRDASPAAVVSLEGRRRSIPMRVFVATAAAAAVVVAVLGIALANSRQPRTPSASPPATSQPAGATMADVRQALAQKGSRRVVMAPTHGHGASLDAVVTPSGVSYLYDPNLTPLGADRTYQLWGVVGTQRISYGLLGTDPASVMRFDAGPGVRALAVTNEPASGVVVTDQSPVVAGDVSPSL
jgi:hypothetical protein